MFWMQEKAMLCYVWLTSEGHLCWKASTL